MTRRRVLFATYKWAKRLNQKIDWARYSPVIFNDLTGPKIDFFFDPLSEEENRQNSKNNLPVMESSKQKEDKNHVIIDSNTGITVVQSKAMLECGNCDQQ